MQGTVLTHTGRGSDADGDGSEEEGREERDGLEDASGLEEHGGDEVSVW